jgi:hypothetical protein
MESKRKIIILFSLLFCLGCHPSGEKVMTKNEFDAIQTGTTDKVLVQEHGKPYHIQQINPAIKNYIYIERFHAPHGVREYRHYVFEIKDGRIVSKHFYQEGQTTIDYLLRN